MIVNVNLNRNPVIYRDAQPPALRALYRDVTGLLTKLDSYITALCCNKARNVENVKDLFQIIGIDKDTDYSEVERMYKRYHEKLHPLFTSLTAHLSNPKGSSQSYVRESFAEFNKYTSQFNIESAKNAAIGISHSATSTGSWDRYVKDSGVIGGVTHRILEALTSPQVIHSKSLALSSSTNSITPQNIAISEDIN